MNRRLAAMALVIALAGCNIGPTELLLTLAILVLLFGATQLPRLARAMGEAVKGFRESAKSGSSDDEAHKLPPAKDVKQIEDKDKR